MLSAYVTEYIIHIENLNQALCHILVSKKVHRMIKFNQKAWLRTYIDMNTKLRQKAKNNFEKDFFKLMHNAVFGKTIKNVGKHNNIKLATAEKKQNCLASEPYYHTTKCFTGNLLAIEMRKAQIVMNKHVHLGLSILVDLSKNVMYEFWYDYVKSMAEMQNFVI